MSTPVTLNTTNSFIFSSGGTLEVGYYVTGVEGDFGVIRVTFGAKLVACVMEEAVMISVLEDVVAGVAVVDVVGVLVGRMTEVAAEVVKERLQGWWKMRW